MTESEALIKLLMTWDIIPGQEQAYFEFNAREFVPQLIQLGLRPTDSWFTLFGETSQVNVGWVSDDPELVHRAVASGEWGDLQQKLKPLVRNFRYKVIPASGPFQM